MISLSEDVTHDRYTRLDDAHFFLWEQSYTHEYENEENTPEEILADDTPQEID